MLEQLVAVCTMARRARSGGPGRRPGPGQAGQSMVEYAITLALIAVAAMVAVQALGIGVGGVFTRILGRLSGIA